MKNFGTIIDNFDAVTKQYVDNKVPTDEHIKGIKVDNATLADTAKKVQNAFTYKAHNKAAGTVVPITYDGSEAASLDFSADDFAYDYSSGKDIKVKLVDKDYVTKTYVDNQDALKLDKVGGSITGNLTVGGNLTVNGTTTTVDSTTLQVKDKLIEVAHGNTATLTTPAGLVAPKYDGTNSGALVFDSTGTAYVGDVTLKDGNIDVANSDLQPLATRTGLVGGNLVQYDSSAQTLKDAGKKISDLALKTDIPNTAKHSSTQLATNTDLNTLNSSADIGWYHVGGGNSCAHKPTGVDAFGLEVGRSAGGWFYQVLTSSNNAASRGRRFMRTYTGTAWDAWKKVAITSDIPTNYVTTDTDWQEITSTKKFYKDQLIIANEIDIGASAPAPEANQYRLIDFLDKNEKRIGIVGASIDTNKNYGAYLQAGNVASMGVLSTPDGFGYSYGPIPPNKDNTNKLATTSWTGRRYKSIADFGFTSQTTVKAIVQKIIDNGYEYCTFACTNDNFNNFSDTPDGYGTLIIEVGSNALRPLISFTKQIGNSNSYKHWQANIVRSGNQVSEIQWYEIINSNLPQTISGAKTFVSNICPEKDLGADLGASNKRWNNIYGSTVHTSQILSSEDGKEYIACRSSGVELGYNDRPLRLYANSRPITAGSKIMVASDFSLSGTILTITLP